MSRPFWSTPHDPSRHASGRSDLGEYRPGQGGRARLRRGADRIPAGILDRPSAVDGAHSRLAMPTMVGAFAYATFKDRAELAHGNITLIAVGFVCSFIFGWIVVKTFLGYVQRHNFALFTWWRIVVGAVGLLAIYFW